MSLYEDLLPAVEQQLTSKETPFVQQALTRLIEKEQMEENEAKQLIAECLGMVVDRMYKRKREFESDLYKELLKNLPDVPDSI